MASYTLTNKAVQDLSSIWEYTVDTWSERQADKYYFMLLDTCQDIADSKVKGKNYPEVNAEILGFKAGQHILFYRILSLGKIEIARILHAQMDLKNRIQDKTTANKRLYASWTSNNGPSALLLLINFSNLALANRVFSGQASTINIEYPTSVKPCPLAETLQRKTRKTKKRYDYEETHSIISHSIAFIRQHYSTKYKILT